MKKAQLKLLVALLACVSVSACGDLLEADQKTIKSARVTVTGTTPVPMLLIVSSQFDATRNPGTGEVFINFVESDTTRITPPFDQSYTFTRAADRFVVRLANADPVSTADIELRVFLDGKEDYRQRATMKDSYLQYTFYNFF